MADDYATLQVVTDSCGVPRTVLRELGTAIEDDRGSSQPTGWWAKFPVPQSTASKVYRMFGLYCYHLSMSGWNLTERAIQSNRELSEWPPREAACLGTVQNWFQKSCPQTGYNFAKLFADFQWAAIQIVERMSAMRWSSRGRLYQRVHAHLESGFESDWAEEMSLKPPGFLALISCEMKSVLA